jgi:WD40 repeat protein
VTTVDFSPDAKTLVIGQRGDPRSRLALALWSLDDRLELVALIRQEGAASKVARFSPSGKLLAYSDPDRNLVVHHLQAGTGSRDAFPLSFTTWLSFAWNRDRLIAGGTRTQVWDAGEGRVVWTLPVEELPSKRSIKPPACALSPEGDRVAASGVERGRIIVYDIATGNVVGAVEGPMDAARSLAIDPSGRYLAAVAENGGAGLWDLQSGELVLPELLNMRIPYYWCVRFHPDGEHVGFGLWSGLVNLIRIRDGHYALRQDAPVHKGIVQDIAFTRDGKKMCSGGDEGAVLIWEI